MAREVRWRCDWCDRLETNETVIEHDWRDCDGYLLCSSCFVARKDALLKVEEWCRAAGQTAGPCPHMPGRLTPCLECEAPQRHSEGEP